MSYPPSTGSTLNIPRYDTQTTTSYSGGTHSVSQSEVSAFAEAISAHLAADPPMVSSRRVPISPPTALFATLRDGAVLCHLVNALKPGAIDARHVRDTPRNPFEVLLNHRLVLSACAQLGLKIVNIGEEDLASDSPDKQYLVLALVWQLLRYGLMSRVNVAAHPEITCLIEQGESIDHFIKLPAEVNLLRWVNFHLAASGSPKRIYNFGQDVADSEAYVRLLHQLDPSRCPLSPLAEADPLRRAELMLQGADRLGCRKFADPQAVVSGNEKLNLAFVATLFNEHPGLSAAALSSGEEAQQRAARAEEAMREKLRREEEDFRRRMEQERARFAQQLEDDAARMRAQLQQNWTAEEDAKRRFLEDEARKLAQEKAALDAERASMEARQRDHAAAMLAAQHSIYQAPSPPPPSQPAASFYPPVQPSSPAAASFMFPPSSPVAASFMAPPPVQPSYYPAPSYYAPPPPVQPSYYAPPPAVPHGSYYPAPVAMAPPAMGVATTTTTTTTMAGMAFYNRALLNVLRITIEEARNVVKKDFFGLGKSDPYCIVQLRDQRHVTRKCRDTTNPVWYEDLVFKEIKPDDELVVAIWDSDRFGKDDFMGECRLRGKHFPLGSIWLPLKSRHGHHDRVSGDLKIKFSII